MELYEDLTSLYDLGNDVVADTAVLKRLVDKLQLTGIADLMQESLALHEMVTTSGGDPDESIEKMSMLLKKIKDFVQTEDPKIDSSSNEKSISLNSGGQASTNENKKTPNIPDDFRCPISLELMRDPVIVSTGQVSTCILIFWFYCLRIIQVHIIHSQFCYAVALNVLIPANELKCLRVVTVQPLCFNYVDIKFISIEIFNQFYAVLDNETYDLKF